LIRWAANESDFTIVWPNYRKKSKHSRNAPGPTLKLYYPVLVDLDFERRESPDDTEEIEPERFYDSAVQVEETSDGITVAVCSFTAGQKIKDTKVLEVNATYFIAIGDSQDIAISDADKNHLLEEATKCSAWQLFRSLFIHMGSQSGMEVPLLPNFPEIRWLKADEPEKQTA
jgi:hypothetical protein